MKKLFIMLFISAMLFSLASCEILNNLPFDIPGLTDKGNEGEGDGDGEPEHVIPEHGENELVLIENGEFKYRFVFSSDAGPSAISKMDSLVKKLRGMGIEIADPVKASETDNISEYEILIGPGITTRGAEYTVNEKEYGEKGYVIKAVGNKILIAGGSKNMTSTAFETFTKNILGVNDKTDEMDSLVTMAKDTLIEKFTEYMIKGITVGGADLSEFVIVKDTELMADYGDSFITSFRNSLYTESGYWLEIIKVDEASDKPHKILIRYTEDAIEGDDKSQGFVARVSGGDFIFESNYMNATVKYFEKTVDELILSKMNQISIPEGFVRFEDAYIARYEDFGAKGDGKTDDYNAILAAHTYANECGQKVVGKEGATYYVDKNFNTSLVMRTSLDLNGATILINDTGDVAYQNRVHAIFNINRQQNKVQWFTDSALKDMLAGHEKQISRDATELPWLVPYLRTQSYVIVTNDNHKDFIRFGANQNAGSSRVDMFLVDKNGKILDGYAPAFEFDDITKVEIYDTDEEEIVLENGSIKNICCRVGSATFYKNKYTAFHRGISVSRSNVTIRNMTFRTVDEPTIDYTNNPSDPLQSGYGKRAESYPYAGFIVGSKAYNLLVENCTLSARTTYYEDKPATESTGGVVPAPVAMGSYGYTYSLCSNVRHENVDQYSTTGLGDARYWGIMNSNTCKNFYFNNCEVNRFDAHQGFWNAYLTNSTFGHTINITGGGEFYMENVTKLTGSSFITIRGDYGGSFDGDVTIKDSFFCAYYAYDSLKGGAESTAVYNVPIYVIASGFSYDPLYMDWDFGYPCTLPHNIVIDNLTWYAKDIFIFTDKQDGVFENEYNLQLGITKSITFKNMLMPIPTCRNEDMTYLSKIPVTVERGQ